MEETLNPLSWLSSLVWGKSEEPDEDKAIVYVYRVGEKKAFFRRFNVWINGEYVGKLDNWGSMALQVEAGPVHIESAIAGLTLVPRLKEELTLDLMPGCHYYVEGNHRSGLWRGSLGLSEVTELTFRKYLNRLKKVGWRNLKN
ncbi:hypothetical protein [Siphonobacter aquaeclarae]|jgi:hypothetical protein|uniref:Uncharacterized protein n=1 Tax=Siphonobacter aquaeclarae TaxID=563176 RepID=A0A1G9PEJ7_9BACT|nr:hypothetical protein [Siphonobacter aquaeclarae]SDL96585.1 hypothetical protein SAMN04488090_2127 [Siphonobacter aquaeclarae]